MPAGGGSSHTSSPVDELLDSPELELVDSLEEEEEDDDDDSLDVDVDVVVVEDVDVDVEVVSPSEEDDDDDPSPLSPGPTDALIVVNGSTGGSPELEPDVVPLTGNAGVSSAPHAETRTHPPSTQAKRRTMGRCYTVTNRTCVPCSARRDTPAAARSTRAARFRPSPSVR